MSELLKWLFKGLKILFVDLKKVSRFLSRPIRFDSFSEFSIQLSPPFFLYLSLSHFTFFLSLTSLFISLSLYLSHTPSHLQTLSFSLSLSLSLSDTFSFSNPSHYLHLKHSQPLLLSLSPPSFL